MRRVVLFLLALLVAVLPVGLQPAFAEEVSSVPVVSSEVSSAEESVGETEFIDNRPSFTLPKEKGPSYPAAGILGWSVIFAAVIGLALFVHTVHVQDRRAFRSRSAARSRWRRRGPVRSGMSEKIHHENSHMRR